jgi:uncharacterized membrane protein
MLTAARLVHWRSILVASTLFVGVALLFASQVTQLPQTMIAASRAALMIGLLGLRWVAFGAAAEAEGDGIGEDADGR